MRCCGSNTELRATDTQADNQDSESDSDDDNLGGIWKYASGIERWCFDCTQWCPSEREWAEALKLETDAEERERIGKFRFRKDAMHSLIGRLILRKIASIKTGLAWEKVQLRRTTARKPVLIDWAQVRFGTFCSEAVVGPGKATCREHRAALQRASAAGPAGCMNSGRAAGFMSRECSAVGPHDSAYPLLGAQTTKGAKYPNLNLSVSHHGNWIVVVSEPVALVRLAAPCN